MALNFCYIYPAQMKNLLVILFPVLLFLPVAQGQVNAIKIRKQLSLLQLNPIFNLERQSGILVIPRPKGTPLSPYKLDITFCRDPSSYGKFVLIGIPYADTINLESLNSHTTATKNSITIITPLFKTYTAKDLHYLSLNAILEQISALKR